MPKRQEKGGQGHRDNDLSIKSMPKRHEKDGSRHRERAFLNKSMPKDMKAYRKEMKFKYQDPSANIRLWKDRIGACYI